MLAMRLCVLHNLYFYNKLMEDIRDAIDGGYFEDFKGQKLEEWGGRA
jgi:queuine tRNA-ribosyltransferase